MRVALAALALALCASGCVCWSQQEFCVDAWIDRCVEGSATECLDLRGDDGEDGADSSVEPDSAPHCGGTWKSGSCASDGYSKRCDGYFVRPGSAC